MVFEVFNLDVSVLRRFRYQDGNYLLPACRVEGLRKVAIAYCRKLMEDPQYAGRGVLAPDTASDG